VEILENYINYLMEKKTKTNVISKTITDENIRKLINDTKSLNLLIKEKKIVDVGSGNGILGVTVAILNPNKSIFLVEPRRKKADYLKEMIEYLMIENVKVINTDIETYLKVEKGNFSMITRGFPDNEKLYKIFEKNKIKQFIAISSKEKFKKIIKNSKIKNLRSYDIKNRETIKIFCLECVSRETL